MKKITFTVFVLLFFSWNFSAQSKITDEEYSIYSAVFESIYNKNKSPSNIQIVIMDSTIKFSKNSVSLESYLRSGSTADQIYQAHSQQKVEELQRSYNERNLKEATIKRKFKIKNDYAIISGHELNKLLIEGKKLYDEMPNMPPNDSHSPMITWKPFLNKYRTDGCYSFSRVGFSKDRKLAIVFVSHSNGISGTDAYYILKKTDGYWGNPKWFGSGWII